MKRFNASKVRASSHLTPAPLKTRAANKREYNKAYDAAMGIGLPKEREYYAPLKADFAPRGFGRKVKGLSPAKRALVQAKAQARREWFGALGVSV